MDLVFAITDSFKLFVEVLLYAWMFYAPIGILCPDTIARQKDFKYVYVIMVLHLVCFLF
jgi:hypothetical protein